MTEPKIVREKTIHAGWLHIVQRNVKHTNGDVQTYEIVNPGSHSVSIVAFDEMEQVLLVEMYRFGQHKRLLELPAGAPKSGETYYEAASRELMEETGYQGELHHVGSHYIAAEHGVTRHVFVAKSCQKLAKPSPDKTEKSEGIKLVKVTTDQFLRILRSGQMTETAAGFMVMDHLRLLSMK